jgi:hypothetical protein
LSIHYAAISTFINRGRRAGGVLSRLHRRARARCHARRNSFRDETKVARSTASAIRARVFPRQRSIATMLFVVAETPQSTTCLLPNGTAGVIIEADIEASFGFWGPARTSINAGPSSNFRRNSANIAKSLAMVSHGSQSAIAAFAMAVR